MEKILKRILIPFLFVILTIKSAYAETINLYGQGVSHYISFNVDDTSLFDYKYSFEAFGDTFNYYLRKTDYLHNDKSFNFINAVIYYQEESNQFLILNFFNSEDNISSSDKSINVKQSSQNSNINYYYKNTSDNWQEYWLYPWGSYGFLTKTDNASWYQTNLSWPSYNVKNTSSSPYYYYLNSAWNSAPNGPLSNFLNNIDKFKFVKVIYDDFYINDELIGSASGESPEDPEEPEEPEIPIFNENLNKFYVPDYQEGQCVEVLDKDTIRVFNDNTTSFYTDYFINSNYISRTGQVDIDYEKNCSTLEFTSDYKYRNDLSKICFISLCIIGFTILPCYVLWKVFYKRG